jgi:Flp pilus assembly protein TadG
MKLFGTFGRCAWLTVRLSILRLKDRSGQALIETALSVPFLLIILFGIYEFASMTYASIEVTNAALAAVQYGAQDASTAADTTGIQNAAENDAGNLTLTSVTASRSCICSNGSASTCLSTDCSTSNIETILTVKTQATFTPAIQFPGLPASFPLNGLAVEKVLQ